MAVTDSLRAASAAASSLRPLPHDLDVFGGALSTSTSEVTSGLVFDIAPDIVRERRQGDTIQHRPQFDECAEHRIHRQNVPSLAGHHPAEQGFAHFTERARMAVTCSREPLA